jgi:hypothetical protein
MKPKIGVLARVKSKFGDSDVYLGPIDEDYSDSQPRVPVGAHVFVIKTVKVKEDNMRCPLVNSEYGIGWLYWDELERIDEVQAG